MQTKPTGDRGEGFQRLDYLRLMVESREGDRREGLLMRQSRGWFQVSAWGHEALGALAWSLRPGDYVFPYYRDRAIALARGITTRELAFAYFATADSSSGGRTMPSHFSSRSLNVFSVATPTGSQCLPATGAAWALKRAGGGGVVLCTIGDAATRQGEFYEAVSMALQENLPVVFLVEDNEFGISTRTAPMNPYTLQALDMAHCRRMDGRDPDAVYALGQEVFENARSGKGPAVLWLEVDRLCSHTCSDDQRIYRSAEELEIVAQRDPIDTFAGKLMAEGVVTEGAWADMKRAIAESVDRDYQAAEKAAPPNPAQICDHVLAPAATNVPAPLAPLDGSATMVSAINQTLRQALKQNVEVVLFGEDIEDPKGGVFGLTKGLSTEFPGRVVNSPLAEATIVGLGIGMAAARSRPVFELQFVDFIGPALNQLTAHASSLRWRTMGEWTCPLVVLAPYGAYLPAGGMWHSQSNDGLLAHIPGLCIAVPSTPADASALLWTAIHGEDPTLVLLPKHLFRARAALPLTPEHLPFGKAAVRREGNDVSIVTWGNCVELALEAAERAAPQGVSVEVVDLRTLVPCDWPAIEASLAKTGRLVVVHEDTRTTGFGQSIIAEMTSATERWELFLAPPQLVTRPDIPVPYHPILEEAALPSIEQVLDAVHTTMT
ncbi:MAG: 2-oxoisovalerate dehydrogenase [Candidatus Hydrogenedentes bacterium]|nr:2-oxoisovalerate dehydrogenase [Candidatus Hydrogenedentota bacterium]